METRKREPDWRESSREALEEAIRVCGSPIALAVRLGVTQQYISQMRRGRRPVPATRCRAIEIATGGAVTRERLRPDVFAPDGDAA